MEGIRPTRLLFVDDSDIARSTVPRLLAMYGFDVTAVGTIENAIGEMKTDKFDVLLCAIGIRCADAVEFISEMNSAQPGCRCFALVDDDDEKIRTALKERAVYIRRPISVDNLVKTIRGKLTA